VCVCVCLWCSPVCFLFVNLSALTGEIKISIAYSAVIKAVHEFVRMREITRSVKVALKCLITVVLVDVNLPYWTSAIFSNICTAPVQKVIYENAV